MGVEIKVQICQKPHIPENSIVLILLRILEVIKGVEDFEYKIIDNKLLITELQL